MISEADQIDLQLFAKGKALVPVGCGNCDFESGQRGMDRCSRCGGTGSAYLVGGVWFPNTDDGYVRAGRAALASEAKGRSKGGGNG